jgi:hypothetical protein
MALTRQNAVLLLVALALTACAAPSSAFCVYNKDIIDVTFFAWPPSAHTFKAVVKPGDSACCNWNNPTCFSKDEGDDDADPLARCADVLFYIADKALDTDAITKKFIAKEVEEILAPFIAIFGAVGGLIPGVGEVIGTVAALTAAGLDVSAISTDTGIEFGPNDQHVRAENGGTVTWIRPNHIETTVQPKSAC